MAGHPPEGRADAPTDRTDPEYVAVGRIGRPHGLGGDVFVAPWTDDPASRFATGAVLIADPGSLTIGWSRVQGGGKLVVHFDGVNERAAAELLHGVELRVAAADRPPIDDPDEFYDTELIGLRAMTVDGRELGPVCDVVHSRGGDHLLLDVDGHERLVPFVSSIVPSVDVEAGIVVIDAPEGLFEL